MKSATLAHTNFGYITLIYLLIATWKYNIRDFKGMMKQSEGQSEFL